ncbi:MAG: metallophosphoesterase [Candidatus Bathyarchaeota archaeon]|nr:MAG: metallophosphoesterase [Candidatus Bathyarchaeota archaeon]
MIRLLTPWPAMLVEGDERLLLAADFHLGIEYELAKMGINIPYQTERFMEELLALVREQRPDRVLLLGDIKHGVPITSFQEKREIPQFFKALLEEVGRVDVVRGNHDANIQNLAPEEVEIHPSRGLLLGEGFRVAALHGHAWPYPRLLAADLIVMGHNHPAVQLNTPLGVRITRRAWVRGRPNVERLAGALLEKARVKPEGEVLEAFEREFGEETKAPQMVIMPTFNDLMGGLPVNAETPKSLLGPLFRTGAVEVDDFDVYLLDGTFLGQVGFLRTLA